MSNRIDQNRKHAIALMHAENERNEEFGGDKLTEDIMAVTGKAMAEIYKANLVTVTFALSSYANAFHNNMPDHDGTFAVCQHEVCVHGRGVIEGAELIVASNPVVPVKEGE